MVHLLVWSEHQCQMEPKNAKNGDLGLEKCKSHEPLFFK